MPVAAVVGLGGTGGEQLAQGVAACAQLVAGGGCDAFGWPGRGAVERGERAARVDRRQLMVVADQHEQIALAQTTPILR